MTSVFKKESRSLLSNKSGCIYPY